MKYWLLKSEPNVWSINQQKKEGFRGATWDGVRNYQAANNLKKIRILNTQRLLNKVDYLLCQLILKAGKF